MKCKNNLKPANKLVLKEYIALIKTEVWDV